MWPSSLKTQAIWFLWLFEQHIVKKNFEIFKIINLSFSSVVLLFTFTLCEAIFLENLNLPDS